MKSITFDLGLAPGPVMDLNTLKTDLRITTNDLDETISAQYMPAAAIWAEGTTKRAMLTRQVQWVVSDFPGIDRNYTFCLPGGIVSSVALITYVESETVKALAGPDSSPAGTDFQQDLSGHVARLMPRQGDSWPDADRDAIQPVKISYTAGWATEKLIPSDIKRAMTAHIYGAMELDGLLQIRPGYDIEHAEKLISAYRSAF